MHYIKFVVLRTPTLKNVFFWDKKAFLNRSSIMNMDKILSSETHTLYQTIRFHIADDSILHTLQIVVMISYLLIR
jgi:hypothetical protein